MQTILRIDASARTEGSYSRQLGDYFTERAAVRFPGAAVTVRDLARDPIEQIRQSTIAGFYTPPADFTPALMEATALSDRLIAELQGADTLLITTPMYNFTVPATLKAWIDQVVRIGHTFAYEDGTFTGLAKPKVAYVCAAYGAGGYLGDGTLKGANFLHPYLEFLLSFLGVEKSFWFEAEALTGDAETVENAMCTAKADIDRHLTA